LPVEPRLFERFFGDRGIAALTLSARSRDETFDFGGILW
jgi:hypothetical protein